LTGSVLSPTVNSSDLGSLGVAFRNLFASTSLNVSSGAASATLSSSGNLTLTGHVLPAANNASDLGSSSSTAFRSIYASNTLYLGGRSATTTLDLRTAGVAGNGTCINFSDTAGVSLRFYVTSSIDATAPWRAIKIEAGVCQ